MESVTWRGLASSGATPGTGSSHRSWGAVSRSPMATIQAPSASQPTDLQTPSHGLIRLPGAAAETVRGVLGGRPRPRFGAAPAASSPTSRSWSPSWTSTWTNRLPSGEGRGAAPGPPPGSPCSRSPAVRTIRSWPSAVSRTTWNQPSASDTNSSDPSGSQWAPTSTLRSPATTRVAPVATSTSAICEVSPTSGPRRAMTAIRVPSGAHSKASTSTPASVRTVGRGGFGSVAGRPRRGTGASISQIWVQPRRRDRKASRWPSGDQRGERPPPGLPTTRVSRDPSASTTQISSSRTKASRRPSGDHCGSETGFSEAVSWAG